MVNVLVIGATGYVGQALTQSLLRSGNHRVYGLARTVEKAQALAREEVIPIIGTISENKELLSAIDAFQINVVVDVSGASHQSQELLELLKGIGQNRISTSEATRTRAPKLGFIYTSGTWVHGSSTYPVNDLSPVGIPTAPTQPAELVAWRTKLEQEILDASDVLDVMIIRPALIYGRSSAIWSSLFQPIYSAVQSNAATVSLAAEPASRPGLVHVDDVSSGLHCAIDRLPLISGSSVYPNFDLGTSQESMRDILEAAARELGFKGSLQLAGSGDDLFAQAMCTSNNGCSGRAKTILGWEPKRYGFVQGMGVFAKAWLAATTF